MNEAESPKRKKWRKSFVFGLCALLGAGFIIYGVIGGSVQANKFLSQTASLISKTVRDILGSEERSRFAVEIDLVEGEPVRLEDAVSSTHKASGSAYEESAEKEKLPRKTSTRKSTAIISEVIKQDQNESISSSPASYEPGDASKTNQTIVVAETITSTNTKNSTEENFTVPPSCDFGSGGTPAHRVIFNEIAWMGSPARIGETAAQAGNREWLELKSFAADAIDLSGWQILDDSEKFHIILGSGEKLASGDFYLLERTSDNTLLNIPANKIYFGALSNTGERLKLFNRDCELMDEIDAKKGWPGGDNSTKQTLERNLFDRGWHTSAAAAGTPKAQNSNVVVDTMNPPSAPESTVAPTPSPSVAPSPEPQAAPPPPPPNLNFSTHLVISAVQISGSSSTNDFIKIYNPPSAPFNLKGYRLVKRAKTSISDTLIKPWASDVFIPAGGYYLWTNSGYSSISETPNATSTDSIADDNGVAIRYGPNDTGAIIDSVAWGAAQNFIESSAYPVNPGANQVLSRKVVSGAIQDTDNNAQDFEIR